MEFAVQVLIVIFGAILSAVGFLLKLGINRVIAELDNANRQLSALHGSIAAIHVWQTQHEGHDNERHQENLQKFDNIFQALN